MTRSIRTNRDLYLFVAATMRENLDSDRSLLTWLSTLGALARRCPKEVLSPQEFADLLAEACVAKPPDDDHRPGPAGRARFDAILGQQLEDLRAFREQGVLDEDTDEPFVVAPSGERWYTLDPNTYMEAGIQGTFGGWREGDDTGRTFMEDPIEGPDGPVDPRQLQGRIFEFQGITWEMFADFLLAGQFPC